MSYYIVPEPHNSCHLCCYATSSFTGRGFQGLARSFKIQKGFEITDCSQILNILNPQEQKIVQHFATLYYKSLIIKSVLQHRKCYVALSLSASLSPFFCHRNISFHPPVFVEKVAMETDLVNK